MEIRVSQAQSFWVWPNIYEMDFFFSRLFCRHLTGILIGTAEERQESWGRERQDDM